MLLFVLAAATIVSVPLSAQTIKQGVWVTNGDVRAIAKNGRVLYVGGSFSYVGPSTGSGVLISSTTGTLLSSSPRINGEVLVAVPDGNNGWYIGGAFTSVNGASRSNAAHILSNGSVDAWDPSPNGAVYSMAFGFNRMFIGGDFTVIGGEFRNRLAAVNLVTGASLAWNPNVNGRVNTIVPNGPSLFIGGTFTSVNDTTRNRVAQIDTNALFPSSRFNPNVNGEVHVITIGSGGIYLGGNFSFVGGLGRSNLALVNFSGTVQPWNPAPNSSVYAIQQYGSAIYVGGDFTLIAGQSRTGIAALNPTVTTLLPWNPRPNASVRSLDAENGLIYFGGIFSSVGTQSRNYLAAADTFGAGTVTAWNPYAGSSANVVATQGAIVFAGGTFSSVNGVARQNLAAIYDSTGVVSAFKPIVNSEGVDALAFSGTTLYVGGLFDSVNGLGRNSIAAVNANDGSVLPWNPNANGPVNALRLSGTNVYAGGSFTTIGGIVRNRIAAIDISSGAATAWNPNANSSVFAIDVAGSNVYAGGLFGSIGGQTRSRIAALDVTTGNAISWNPNAGTGGQESVSAILVDGSIVFVGGQFTSIGGQTRNSLAAIDIVSGAATPFNALLNTFTSVQVLLRGSNNLYIGGFLNSASPRRLLPFSDVVSVNPITGVARAWDPEVVGPVYSGAIIDTNLFLGGGFNSVQGQLRPYVVGLGDESLQLPAIAISQVSFNFGNVRVGQVKTDSVLVTNGGGSSLNIISAVSDNAKFAVAPANATIPPGTSRRFFITFTPTDTILQNGVITLGHNAPGSPTHIAVQGHGIAPVFSAIPASLNFGDVVVSSSKQDSLTVANTGTSVLNIASVTSSSPRYSVIPTNAVINPNTSRKFFVTFSPIASGAVNGNIIFTHDAAGSPTNVAVTGTGIVSAFAVNPASLDFGNVVVSSSKLDSVTVSNTGAATLTITNVASTQLPFSVTPTSATIGPSSTRKFFIRFAPTDTGLGNANIVFTHNAPGSPSALPVAGVGVVPRFQVSPPGLLFGTVLIGATKQDSLFVTNTGTSQLDISNVTNARTQYVVVPRSASLAAGARAHFLVSFTPTITGTLNDTLRFVHNGAGSPTPVPVSGTGGLPAFGISARQLPLGSVVVNSTRIDSSILVTNTGSAPLTIANVTSSDSQFAVTPRSVLIPASGGTQRFVISFRPNSIGTKSANFVFIHNASTSPDTLRASGSGVTSNFSIAPTSIAFGTVSVGASKLDSVTVSNSHIESPIDISSVVSDNPQFSVNPTSGVIAPLGSGKFFIRFSPTTAGTISSNITFLHNAPGSPTGINVSGAGLGGVISISRLNMLFGNVRVGTTRQDTLLVRNLGTDTLVISNATLSDPRFAVAPQTARIAPAANRIFTVTFAPTEIRQFNAVLQFSHNAPGSISNVNVSGAGVGAVMSVRPRPLRFANIAVGSRGTQTITITNVGNANLNIDSVRVRGRNASEFIVVGSSGPFRNIVPLDSARVSVQFGPTSVDSIKSAFLIISNDALMPLDSVPLNGGARSAFVQTQIIGDSTVGSPMFVDGQAPQGFVTLRATLFYRKAGRRQFDSLDLLLNGQSFVGRFPDSVVTPRGIEYFIRLAGIGEFVTNPEINPEVNPAVVQVKVPLLASPQVFQRRVYKMISIPLELTDASLATQLVDNLGEYNPILWRLFLWDGTANAEFPAIPKNFTPGNAFWLITQAGIGFDAKLGRSVTSARPAQIELEPGWNQIASPFAFPTSWQNIVGNQTVSPPFFFNGSEYVPNIQILNPWDGYFVFNDSTQRVTLSVPPIEAVSDAPKVVAGTNEYVIQISATATNLRDRFNYVGLTENALAGRGREDLRKPPMVGEFIKLSIQQDDIEYAANYKPLNAEGQHWDVRLTSNVSNQSARVALSEIGARPSDFNIYVLDRDAESPVSLTDRSFPVQLDAANSSRLFTLIIGTQAYAERASAGIPLVPIEYSLSQNYPNPFNPSTTIRYALSRRSNVVLEIFNMLGQKVSTLVNSEQTTGRYSVVWNGLTDDNSTVASGVYLVQMRAGEFRASTKLILLR